MDAPAVNVLSLCSGVGMLDIGIGCAVPGTRTVCYVEREAYAVGVLVQRMQDKTVADAPVWSDIRTFDGRPWRSIVDLLIGGYPCQDFSCAGKRAGLDGDKGGVWHQVARIVREVQPECCFFENVPGHLTLGFDTVVLDLERLGYRVKAGLFSAAECGASHKRERLFIMAHRTSGGAVSGKQSGRRDGVVAAGAELAHAEGEGSQGADTARDGAAGWFAEYDGLPLFAPGPGETGAWGEILERWPDLSPAAEPEICRTVDGVAYRLDSDQLRCTGNGVVPLVAGYAFVSLWAAIERKD